jgi:hypothetical protein
VAEVIAGRMTAEMDGDFVVFLIGMRVNRWWKLHKWWPVVTAMSRMLKELAANPESGCLATESGFGTIVQYWRSFDHLEAYARAPTREHWPAWTAFNKRVRASSGDVGIWHETFLVAAGQFEALYGSMPPKGLARAGRLVPVVATRNDARQRVGT